AGHPDLAERVFAGFGADFPKSPWRARALLDLAAQRLGQGRPNAARLALDVARPLVDALPAMAAGLDGDASEADHTPATAATWRTEIDALDAEVSLAQNDGAGAARRFQTVAERLGTGPQAEAAAFDAVLGWLRAADAERFAADKEAFAARFPGSPLAGEFPLEEGLARAGRTPAADAAGRRHAAASLREFLRANPDGPRAAEAHIALAELAFERPHPAVSLALRELAAPDLRLVTNDAAPSTADPATPAERDRAAYLAIWLADAPGTSRDADHAIALAKKFLTERPDSTLVPEARMKLGEMYFQREDYPDAQTQLELLAENAPDSALAEPALYLAGVSATMSGSAAGLDKALTLFGRAARRNGPFRLRAQLQQADVRNRLGKSRDALAVYDDVLAATANNGAPLKDEDLEARCAALCGRGQTLVTLASAASGEAKDLLREAVAAFGQLAGQPGASLFWQRQALTLKGEALEKLGDTDAALAAYDDALGVPEPASSGPAATVTPPPEWTWFYRAGRDAALLLEKRAQWEAAIAVYEKVAAANGPMKSEFENLLSRRRLEHFVWGGAQGESTTR
ncbi:MAG: tetratricopeptide repeat protein, partial [Gluconacetobacter diazotrophicus]|nr:tetratricopeptide repeat protein [Gluconacetobacter diazotrophicus]